jgi:hypothetical protein
VAGIYWPEVDRVRGAHLKASVAGIAQAPFILTNDEDYPDGINFYLAERVRGSASALHDDPTPLMPKGLRSGVRGKAYRKKVAIQAMGQKGAYKIANALADFVTWTETERAHPSLGVIHWSEVRAWHITELYMTALVTGHWTAHFFRHGVASPLNPRSTIKPRISAILGCYLWMSRHGYVREFDYQPAVKEVTRAKDACLLSYQKETRTRAVNDVPMAKRSFRLSPSDLDLPPLEHLTDFFEAFSDPTHRLVAMLMFESGMRAEEVVENTLLPGKMHTRDHSGKWWVHPEWPKGPYLLEHSLSDPRMLGVLPTREMAFVPEARRGYQCDYKIVGKGFVGRNVHIPPALLMRMWKHADTKERSAKLAKRLARGLGEPANLFLNQYGDRLEYHAIWESFRETNKKVKRPIRLTPHLMRHAFACYFLEKDIYLQAEAMGISPDELSADMIMQLGQSTKLTLKQMLGHKEMETVDRYLVQIANSHVRLRVLESWNNFLDRFEDSHG